MTGEQCLRPRDGIVAHLQVILLWRQIDHSEEEMKDLLAKKMRFRKNAPHFVGEVEDGVSLVAGLEPDAAFEGNHEMLLKIVEK